MVSPEHEKRREISQPPQERAKSIMPFESMQSALQTLDVLDSSQYNTSRLAIRRRASQVESVSNKQDQLLRGRPA
jgi:hypothetical protein